MGEVTREQAIDMAEAHAEGLHDENFRQFCPECEGRDLSTYPKAEDDGGPCCYGFITSQGQVHEIDCYNFVKERS